ncbi:hypothetical protein BGZ82_008910 [Podila clonocystis]|nr:hypothetical protein BGZ82_008910 [Podila clonocystis]
MPATFFERHTLLDYDEAQAKIRKQKLAAKRNWVIPPGLVLIPSMESCNMSWANDPSECSVTPESARDMPWASPFASQSCVSLPEISRTTPDSDMASLSDSFVSTSSAASLPASTRSLDNLDSLSHRLWAFEMQMRRASFLVDDRASVLSTIVPSNAPLVKAQEKESTSLNVLPLRLMTGKSVTVSDNHRHDTSSSSSSSSSSESSSPVEADIEKGWLAWQSEWTHSMRRSRLPVFARASSPSDSFGEESDGDSSTVFSSIRSSHSSVVTAISSNASSPTSSNLHKERFTKAGKPVNSNLFLTPKALNSKWHQVSDSALSSPRTTPATPCSIKDNDPALWETEHGQKWSDRFQFLVHNFQAAAGKHTRRLADIIPKSRSGRWGSKRMRSRHGEKEEEVRVK